MSVNHYENFPVASVLCPPALRPAIRAIYVYARTADDIADEGHASAPERLADLAAYGADLERAARGVPTSGRWDGVFTPLAPVIAAHRLPVALLADLLDAFAQDVVKQRYADRAELLDYCRRSANPVGRLLLHLYGVDDALALRRSDAICTALQLSNFWQDLGVDSGRGRIYLPATDCARHGIGSDQILAQVDDPRLRAAVAEVCGWTAALMDEGAPLAHTIGRRAGFELRLVVQGGRRILEKIAAIDHATMATRPTIAWHDAPLLLWRALQMRPVHRLRAEGAA